MSTALYGEGTSLQLVPRPSETTLQLKEIFAALDLTPDVNRPLAGRLPFCGNDVTAGSKMELQASVAGRRQSVDLPQAIERSNYFAHILRLASLSVYGRSVPPFGPLWLDRLFVGLFRLKGDYVPDFRLIDYPAWLLSSYQQPAWDGRLGNQERLRQDLAEVGIFDNRMPLYLLIKLREFGNMGFTGFEGRQFSLLADYQKDMGRSRSAITPVIPCRSPSSSPCYCADKKSFPPAHRPPRWRSGQRPSMPDRWLFWVPSGSSIFALWGSGC